jgi:uncharacterized protein involved in exopolysaccharide biosynthesis
MSQSDPGFDVDALKREIKREIVKQKILETFDDEEISFSEYLGIFERNALYLILVPVLVFAIGWMMTTERTYYQSHATLFMHGSSASSQPQASGGLSGLLSGLGISGGSDGGGSGYLGAIMESRRMQQDVMSRVNLASYPNCLAPEWKNIKTEKSGLMRVAVSTTIATLSQALVNAHLEAMENQMNRPAKKKRKYLEMKLEFTEKELKQKEEELKKFQLENQCLTIENKVSPVYTKFHGMKNELFESGILVRITDEMLKKLGNISGVLAAEMEKLREEIKKKVYTEVMPEMAAQLTDFPRQLLEFKKMERELKLKEGLYASFLQQLEVAKVNDIEEEGQFEVVDEALPGVPLPKNMSKKVVAASIISFFAVLSLVILGEIRAAYKGERKKD